MRVRGHADANVEAKDGGPLMVMLNRMKTELDDWQLWSISGFS